ncbi:MAG TPA: ATP-binding cassette domain-containing protein, partial [Clostridia bacterium]|nr:ATP-binding cassette domain-containing protein [Clostridia bacterium]
GIAGIAGSGQKELCEAIAGLYPIAEGEVLFINKTTGEKDNLAHKTPTEIIELGVSMAFVPEDRLGMGLVASMDMVDNVMLKSYRLNKGPLLDRKAPKALAESLIKKLDIITPGTSTPVARLSGGNVQKVLLGREIAGAPSVLLVAYPVRGLDINSSYTIYDLLNEQKRKDVAVLFIGEDLDVLLELCDRILVLCGGKVSGLVDARGITKEEIGLMMMHIDDDFKQREGEVGA